MLLTPQWRTSQDRGACPYRPGSIGLLAPLLLCSRRELTAAGSLCEATFCTSLRETDPQEEVVRAFVERLTAAVCYTTKWLKSS